jgi:putative sugar-binding protein
MTLPLDCIADDFTGGTDLAGMLVKNGLRTLLVVGVPETRRGLVAARRQSTRSGQHQRHGGDGISDRRLSSDGFTCCFQGYPVARPRLIRSHRRQGKGARPKRIAPLFSVPFPELGDERP